MASNYCFGAGAVGVNVKSVTRPATGGVGAQLSLLPPTRPRSVAPFPAVLCAALWSRTSSTVPIYCTIGRTYTHSRFFFCCCCLFRFCFVLFCFFLLPAPACSKVTPRSTSPTACPSWWSPSWSRCPPPPRSPTPRCCCCPGATR